MSTPTVRTYAQLHAAGKLNPEKLAVPLSGLESQKRFLFLNHFSLKMTCPLGCLPFSILDTLGGDVAKLDELRASSDGDEYACPTCGAKCLHTLPLMGPAYWRLAPGQRVVEDEPEPRDESDHPCDCGDPECSRPLGHPTED